MILSLKTQTRDGGRFEKIVRGTSTRDCSLGTNETIYKMGSRPACISLVISFGGNRPPTSRQDAQRSWLGDGSELTKEPQRSAQFRQQQRPRAGGALMWIAAQLPP